MIEIDWRERALRAEEKCMALTAIISWTIAAIEGRNVPKHAEMFETVWKAKRLRDFLDPFRDTDK